jgi:hypothetical protein
MAVDVFNVGETLTAQNVNQRLADLAAFGVLPVRHPRQFGSEVHLDAALGCSQNASNSTSAVMKAGSRISLPRVG